MPAAFLSRAMTRLFVCAVFAASGGARSADTVATTFNEDDQWLMQMILFDGTPVRESFVSYSVGKRWYLPIEEVSGSLGIAVEVSPREKVARGFVLRESQKFLLEPAKCSFSLGSRSTPFSCDLVSYFDDDIYVESELLETMYPIDLEIDSSGSRIIVHPREKLPLQLRRERDEAAKQSLGASGESDPGYPRLKVFDKTFEGPIVDHQSAATTSKVADAEAASYQHDTLFSGETLGLESFAFVGGSAEKVERSRFSLAKRDPSGQLGGPLGLREIQLLDFNMPSLPLIGGAIVGKGASISSYPLHQPSNFSQRDFIGTLQAGWEVELYQNDVLVGRNVSREGRYEFKNVPLVYGLNRFRLAFYGPQGQRRERFETHNIDSSLAPPGSTSYRFALANINSEHNRSVVQADHSLSPSLSTRFAFANIIPTGEADQRNYGLLGLSGYFGTVLLNANYSVSEYGGNAREVGGQAQLDRTSIGASHTSLTNYTSDLFTLNGGSPVVELVKANLSTAFFSKPTLRLTFESAQRTFADARRETVLTQRASIPTGRIFWFNSVGYGVESKAVDGELAAISTLAKTELRAKSLYDARGATIASLDVQRNISQNYSAGLGYDRQIRAEADVFRLSLNRLFESLTLSAQGSYQDERNYSAGLVLSTSLIREPRQHTWHVRGEPQASYGSASVMFYLDKNHSGRRDPGEPPLKGLRVYVNNAAAKGESDEEGLLLVGQLPPHQPVDLTISLLSLEDPMLRPKAPGVRFYPRGGRTVLVNYPVVIVGELSGVVQVENANGPRGKGGIELELVDGKDVVVGKAISEPDGFYLFQNIRPGDYKVRLEPKRLRKKGYASKKTEEPIVIKEDGSGDDVKDFYLEKAFGSETEGGPS